MLIPPDLIDGGIGFQNAIIKWLPGGTNGGKAVYLGGA